MTNQELIKKAMSSVERVRRWNRMADALRDGASKYDFCGMFGYRATVYAFGYAL